MKYSFLLLSAACVLFPSCVRWNIGENILTARETRVALDYTQPVDGKIYRVARQGREPRYFARLPEVRYRVMPDIVRLDMYDFKGYAVCGKEATGREALAEVKLDWSSSQQPEKRAIGETLREVEAIPASAVALPYAPEAPKPLSPYTAAAREAETAPGWPRRTLASTLSYTIDPALTVVSTTAFTCGEMALALAASPFLCVYYMLNAGPAECEEGNKIPSPAKP